MSWANWARRAAPLLLILALGACGLRPLYGTNSVGAAMSDRLGTISVGVIGDRTGQILRTELIRTLNPQGRPAQPAYDLGVSVAETQQDVNIVSDLTTTRRNLTLTASFVLTDRKTGQPAFSDSVNEITSYNILADQYTTLIGERDARERALHAIAEDIRTRLALYFDRHP
ncbi:MULTISPECIES: LPS assembly lipoprotein LptE [Inquilinus]|jgi:LPS-assembly lipoprotein|uniref:LPS-assembly lipoprotein n=1 Tax=Inquilinus ginsengisoli TaxID=363840 RepID=A0ABU1JZ98_9PROT|nr:LPS assembly lipoprotein LptE [Inquilinus ginsengisoli]MDR6293648.1 LPS-assembly lipoprotein [Inquilinus ginsengisoli]